MHVMLAPAILGLVMAGTVEAIGPGVAQYREGDEVYGMIGGVGGLQGSLAEHAAVDADLVALKPVNLSMREAAALPLIFITAWEGLVDRAALAAGWKVLVHGGGGGVGHVAIQLAKPFGAEIFATDSESKRAAIEQPAIEQLGAMFINHRVAPVDDYVKRYTGGVGFDLVYDTVGGAALNAGFNAVRRFGHVNSCLGWGTRFLAPLSFRAATSSGVFTLLPLLTGEGRRRQGDILREATRLVEGGKVVPRLDHAEVHSRQRGRGLHRYQGTFRARQAGCRNSRRE